MQIDLVVFDMAGTTVHDPGGVNRCFRDALLAGGFSVEPSAVDAVMGLPKREAIRRLLDTAEQKERLLPRLDTIHADFVGRMIEHYRRNPEIREVSGTSGLFARLRS